MLSPDYLYKPSILSNKCYQKVISISIRDDIYSCTAHRLRFILEMGVSDTDLLSSSHAPCCLICGGSLRKRVVCIRLQRNERSFKDILCVTNLMAPFAVRFYSPMYSLLCLCRSTNCVQIHGGQIHYTIACTKQSEFFGVTVIDNISVSAWQFSR